MIRHTHLTVAALVAGVAVSLACEGAPVTTPAAEPGDGPTQATHQAEGPQAEASPPSFTRVTARETICRMIAPGETRQSGGKIHFSGRVVETRAVSDDPRYTGTNLSRFSGWQDAEGNGRGVGWIVFRPDAVDGTWEGGFSGGWTGGLFTGRGRAHGTGALRGQTLHVGIEEVVLGPDHPDHTCTPALPHGPQFRVTVRIVDSGV